MKKFIVTIDSQLSNNECEQIAQSIKRFSGVLDVVSADGDSQPDFETEFQPPPSEPSFSGRDKPISEVKSNDINSRQAISYAVKWAIRKGMIDSKQLKNMSPEQVVSFALKTIDRLPESEKKELGRQLSEPK